MFNFKNDYSVGAHPNILNKLIATNLECQPGYGEDSYSIEAKNILKQKINNKNAKIFLLSGGTQTNLIAVDLTSKCKSTVFNFKVNKKNFFRSFVS